MTAFTRELERTLRRALSIAGEKGQKRAGSAHLALALLYDADAKELFRACEVDVTALKASLHQIADNEVADHQVADAIGEATAAGRGSAQAGLSFNRVIRRALAHMHASGRELIAGWQVLIALLAEVDDGAVQALSKAGLTSFDAKRYVSHGLRKWQDPVDSLRRLPACDPGEAVRVLLLNDDYTPLEFVVEVLRGTFGKSEDESRRLMLDIHRRGFAECGAYLPEEAAATVAAVAKLARDHQHPLDCVMEPTRGLSDALLFKKPRTIAASGSGDRQRA